jgi:hypothetical protein
MHDSELEDLLRVASERQLALAALEDKYAQSHGLPSEQLVKDMHELLAKETTVLNAIITLFIKMSDETRSAETDSSAAELFSTPEE